MPERKPRESLYETVQKKQRGHPTQLHKQEYYPVRNGEAAHFTSNLISDVLPVATVVHVSDAKTKEQMHLSEGAVHKPANEIELQAAILILTYIFADDAHSFIRAGSTHNVAWNNKNKTGYLYDLEESAAFFRLPEYEQIPVGELSIDIQDELERKLVILENKFQGDEGLQIITEALAGKKIIDVMDFSQGGLREGVSIPEGLNDDEWIQRYQEILLRRIETNLHRIRDALAIKDNK